MISLTRTVVAAVTMAALGAVGAAAAPTAATPPSATTIHIKDFAYRPTPATIHAGDSVTFVNDDDEAHTVTATDKSYDSGGLDTGNRWQYTFAAPGTYTYFCALHPYMKATIVVLPGQKPAGDR